MKLKPNLFKANFKAILLCALAALAVGSGFSAPKKVSAADLPPNKVVVSTDIEVNGKKDNLIRMVKGGTASFTVDLTVSSAGTSNGGTASQINLSNDADNFDFDTTFGKRPIRGFGAGLDIFGNGNTCSTQNIVGLIPFFTNNKGYLNCQFPGGTNKTPSPAYQNNIITVGQTYKYTFNLNANALSQLKINPSSTANTTQSFGIYPYFDIYVFDQGTVDLAYTAASKQIYIQFFNDQASLDQAAASGARPSDVPGYGGNSGGAGTTSDSGSTLLGFLNQIIGLILGFVQEVIYVVFYLFIAPLLQALLSIRTYTDAFAGVIYPGWIVVRNICNILFIVAIIAIGLATLFQVQSYQYKHLLVQLIIAALLVNFSLVIGQVVLGVADTMQNQFLPNNTEVIRALARDLMVGTRDYVLNWNIQSKGYFTVTIKQFFYVAMAMGSFGVFCAITIFLVIRIVALWILLMVSPIAYVAGVLPITEHYRKEWWSNFLKYAFFTPVMAFFLNMAAIMSQLQRDNPVLKQVLVDPSTLGTSDLGSFVFVTASNIFLLIFLFVSLMIAEKAGVYGASAITGIAKKGMFAPFAGAGWLAKRGQGRLSRYWDEKTEHWFLAGHEGKKPPGILKKAAFAALNPVAFAKGWEKHAQELSHEAKEIAEAGGREVAEQFLTGGKLKIPYRQFVERSAENNYLKDYENMRKESLMESAVAAEGMKGAEGEMRRRAIVKAAAKNGYLDDLLRMTHFAQQFASTDGTLYSAEVLNRFLFKYLGHGEQSMRFMAEDMEQLGKDTGHYEYLGHAYYDPDEHNFKRGMEKIGEEEGIGGRKVDSLKNTWQVKFAIGELKKVGGRQRAGIAPHNLVSLRANVKRNEQTGQLEFTEKMDQLDKSISMGREDGELDEFQLGAIGIFDPATLRDAHFAQSRLKEWIYSRVVDQNTGEIIIKDEQDRKRIESIWKANPAFMKQMYAQITGVEPKDATGVRMAILDENGNKAPLRLGEPESMPAPVGTQVAVEVIKNKDFALEKGQKDYLIDNLPTIVSRMYVETYSKGQAIEEIKRSGVDVDKAEKIVDDVYNKISGQLEQKYNPMPVLDVIDARIQRAHGGDVKQGLSQGVKFALNQKILEKVRDRYRSDQKFDGAKIKAHLEKALQQLTTENQNKPEFGKLGEIGDAEVDLMVKDIIPILGRDDV